MKNGKKTEKKRKFKKKLKFEKRIRPFPFFEICVFFPAIFRQFSGNFPAIFRFSKRNPFLIFSKNGQKTDKKRRQNFFFKFLKISKNVKTGKKTEKNGFPILF